MEDEITEYLSTKFKKRAFQVHRVCISIEKI